MTGRRRVIIGIVCLPLSGGCDPNPFVPQGGFHLGEHFTLASIFHLILLVTSLILLLLKTGELYDVSYTLFYGL